MSQTITLPSDADKTGRDFGDEELALLREVLESGTLNCTKGTQVKAFEQAFAKRLGMPHSRAVTSGTAAIHTAVAAIDPEPGDEIITTSITDMGGIAPILYQQAIPIFADVDPVTLNVTPEAIASRITPRTRAIIATHLFGNPCDMTGIMRIAAAHGIPVIEDCAQAFLATEAGRLVGAIGAIGAFSLQQGKHMTTGEGGIVVTADPKLARWMTLFSDKAWGYGDPKPDHYFLALNYRMTDLQGAVACAQLAKLDGVVARRQRTAAKITEMLAGTPGITLPSALPNATHVYWKYPLIVDPSVIAGGADALGAALKASGVFCAPRYIQKPAFECQVFTDRKTFGKSQAPYSTREREDGTKIVYDTAEYPGTMQGLERVVVLPWNEFYTDEHVRFIARAVQNAVAQLAARPRGVGLAASAAERREPTDVSDARPYAVFSCDLDTVDRHLQGYGIDDLPACDRIYRTAVPRLLAMLEELGVPGVFFFIARDAEREQALLRKMVAAGHEVASHSMTHPQPFRTLADDELAREVDASRTRLSAACGTEVIGFRAPAWDVDDRVLARIAAAGYRYDASVFPTPVLIASRLSAYRRSGAHKGSIFSMDLIGHAFAPALPHRAGIATNGLIEFPISVTRWLRLPVYHTFQYFVPPRLFARGVRALLRSGRPVCYEFHAADLLDLAGDDVDQRMDRHPGMRLPLARKQAMLRDTLAAIARERRVITYRQALEERLAA